MKHFDLASLKKVSVKIQQYLKQLDGALIIIDDMRMGKEKTFVFGLWVLRVIASIRG
ncbi:MAG: hypothetical protein ACJAXN_002875 [Psychromonas sp.]|jgi:hypothetical protein